jgi:hypothetical protein
MPLAAVRALSSPERVSLVECGDLSPSSGQTVTVRIDGHELTATVIATADQIISGAAAATGTLVRIHESPPRDAVRIARDSLKNHPAATLPGLGQTVKTSRGSGRVVGLDVPHGLAKIRLPSGEIIEVPWRLGFVNTKH